jgi:hypothetical protein
LRAGLSNSDAWAMVDRLDDEAVEMEEVRQRIGDAFSGDF